MPMKLSQIGAQQRTLTVEYFGESVDVTYIPKNITPHTGAELRDAQEDGDALIVAKMLAKTLVDWDVLGDDGKPMKPTEELLAEMPSSFLGAILAAISEDSVPNRKSVRR